MSAAAHFRGPGIWPRRGARGITPRRVGRLCGQRGTGDGHGRTPCGPRAPVHSGRRDALAGLCCLRWRLDVRRDERESPRFPHSFIFPAGHVVHVHRWQHRFDWRTTRDRARSRRRDYLGLLPLLGPERHADHGHGHARPARGILAWSLGQRALNAKPKMALFTALTTNGSVVGIAFYHYVRS